MSHSQGWATKPRRTDLRSAFEQGLNQEFTLICH